MPYQDVMGCDVPWCGMIAVGRGTLRSILLRFQERSGVDCFTLFEWLRARGGLLDEMREAFVAYGAVCRNGQVVFRERSGQPNDALRMLFSIPMRDYMELPRVPIRIYYPEPKRNRLEPARWTTIVLDLDSCHVRVIPPRND